MNKGEAIVLFDGVCNLCNGAVQFIIKRDRHERFRFAAQQSEAGQRLLHKFGLDPNELGTMVLVEGGQCYVRSDAALRIARKLDGLWPGCYAGIVVPRPIRNAVYGWVARNRYRWFGRQESCMLPTPAMARRFVRDDETI